jgi:hypothetical protein
MACVLLVAGGREAQMTKSVVKIPWLQKCRGLARSMKWLFRTLALLAMVCLAAAVMLWWSRGCHTEVLASNPSISGFNFEVSVTDCWHNPETGVFVARPGQREKTLLFRYLAPEVPTITALDEHTVQIALGDIDQIFCREDKWQELTVKYDIRSIRYSGSRPEPQKCK